MGTARDPVVGSGDWPACTASVANCKCFSSDIVNSFRISAMNGECCSQFASSDQNSCQQRNWPESFLGSGPFTLEIGCAYRNCVSSDIRTGPICIHMHMAMTPFPH